MADQLVEKKDLLRPEVVLAPEKSEEAVVETRPETPTETAEKVPETAPVSKISPVPAASAAKPAAAPKSEVMIEVEKILEEGLGDLYQGMPLDAQKKFREKGEEVSLQISIMVQEFKIQFKRALQLIRDWLLCIPSVNKFFLEQEAKIKVDMLIELAEVRKTEKQNHP
jgi:hypothetical protein